MTLRSQRVLRREYRGYIDCPAVETAYDCLVDGAAAMNGCDGYFTQEKRSFVFKGKNTEEPSYSFIVNKKWLLFYFREPTRSSRQRREQQLREMFGERLK